jgi:hypothetical protein
MVYGIKIVKEMDCIPLTISAAVREKIRQMSCVRDHSFTNFE